MEQLSVKVICFAGLRKYFGNEVEVRLESGAAFKSVLDKLAVINPEAGEVLQTCRIAVDEKFVSPDSPLNETNTVFLIPPSSGG